MRAEGISLEKKVDRVARGLAGALLVHELVVG
jgi:hypothetical protein